MRYWKRHLIAGSVGVLVGYLLFASMRGAGAAPPPTDALSAFTIVVNAIVNLFGQAVLAIVQAFATYLNA